MTFLDRLSVVLLAALTLTACDLGTNGNTASVAVDLISLRALGDCDGASPSEYQILVGVRDVAGFDLTNVTLPEGTVYGQWPGGAPEHYLWLQDGERVNLNTSLWFSRPRDPSGGFTLYMSAIEWDAGGARDANMDDVTVSRPHRYSADGFQNTVGEQTLRVRGGPGCDVLLHYQVSVE